MGRRGRDTHSCQKPHPRRGDPQPGEISFFLRTKRFVICIRHSNPWKLHWRDRPPKYMALKTNGAYVRETQKAVGNGDSAPKGFVCRLTGPEIQGKSSCLKVPRPYGENTHLLILKCLPEGQGTVGTFSRHRSAGRCHFLCSSFTLLALACVSC